MTESSSKAAMATVYGTIPTAEAERTVEVMAPSDLPTGYSFYVWEATNPAVGLLVEVPAGGGVRAGETFQAIVKERLTEGPHSVPTGHWRDGLCDCCTLGCCHPHCCLAWWCEPCALGQVLTRFHLNWCGKRTPYEQGKSAFFILFWLYTVYLVVSNSLSAVVGQFTASDVTTTDDEFGLGGEIGDLENAPGWVIALNVVRNLLDLALFVFMLVVTIRMRRFLRDRYRIPEKCCRGCEDCCCAFWCMPCSICQMARHSADYGTYKAGCCAEDGLAEGAPSVV